jgi:hypothetical protein
VNRLRAKYIVRADAICRAATARFEASQPRPWGTELEDIAASSKAAALASEKALTELRALPPPEADRARVNRILLLMEQQTEVLRQTAVAAAAGDATRVRMLGDARLDMTRRKDDLVYRLASLWGVPPGLDGCPVSLTA